VSRDAKTLLLFVISAIPLLSTLAIACTRIPPTFKVRGDFAVHVRGRDGTPLEGITVKIAFAIPTLDKVAEQLTDKDGKAFFHKMMVSDYWISAERAGVVGTIAKLWPVDDSSGGTEVTLTWPAGPIATLQSIAGPLLAGNMRAPLVGADVQLTDTVSGKELGRTTTDAKGMFAFQVQPSGLYVLHIADRQKCDRYLCNIKGNILVEVDPKAGDAGFPRYGLIKSSCGLSAFKDDGTMVIFE